VSKRGAGILIPFQDIFRVKKTTLLFGALLRNDALCQHFSVKRADVNRDA
jgi:hypothetical protein